MQNKTFKIILVATASVLGALLVGGGVWLWVTQNQFTSISNNAYGIQMMYPKSWQATKDYEKTVFTFLSPPESSMDVFRENVNVVIQKVPNAQVNLEQYADLAAKQLTVVLKNTQLLKNEPVRVGKMEARRLLIEAKQPDQLMIEVTMLLENQRAIIITYTSRSFRYADDLKLVRTMINSLTLSE